MKANRIAASVTAPQGIEIIKEMIRDIDNNAPLRQSVFGESVKIQLVSMKARLMDGAFFSARMEKALENWNIAIHRDHDGKAQKASRRWPYPRLLPSATMNISSVVRNSGVSGPPREKSRGLRRNRGSDDADKVLEMRSKTSLQ